ncbi:MAG: DUF488 domain-containing protein [Bacteroidota bacterium]
MAKINIKRIYKPADETDGFRILVDRFWPRGIKKDPLPYDEWIRPIAPSNELRKWFDHDPEKWNQFQLKYTLELTKNASVDNLLKLIRKNKQVTLLYAAYDEEHNHALVLQQFLNILLK